MHSRERLGTGRAINLNIAFVLVAIFPPMRLRALENAFHRRRIFIQILLKRRDGLVKV